ncbi:MAG: ATP-dependent helicase RecG [Tenuifilum sp.]|jgi:ATP-dependent DNA helicase RecG|uniref:ATP-dependent DNA helicase RecG n=1 Tax=Tenuifilum sp. TaxID=2760880 RepID=UPI0024AA0545|nr:ATP-dependent DNA helicase RecG [Tenuifilum sp.]MDI3527017.1 ATP-dependent helicase RecG [Tenuifilum sp.]
MSNVLDNDIMYLPGVGPKRSELLKKELGIFTFGDLLYFFPYRHIDRTKIYKIAELTEELPYVQVVGRIINISEAGAGRNRRLKAIITDSTGTMEMVWFKGINWVIKRLKPNIDYLFFGKASRFGSTFSMAHPEMDIYSPNQEMLTGMLQPVYSTTEKLKSNHITSKTIMGYVKALLPIVKGKIQETLTLPIIEKHKLMTLQEALFNVHFPQNPLILRKAQYRIKFEELFYTQLSILSRQKVRQVRVNGHVFKHVGVNFNRFYYEKLPFPLTNAQKRVIKEIRNDMISGKQMNRLLQGDVGSGKTVVALMCMLLAVDNGYQACIMAPTEILANQHFESITNLLGDLPVTVGLLTGSTKKSERNTLHKSLEAGELQILIGTHALIEDVVKFKNLGLVVIDEQQRFGVAQRAKLWEKNDDPPHVLVMTATPIPRTLAMTVYGDLDVSIIDELPPGRKPVKTIHYTDAKRNLVFGLMREQIEKGRQVYVVYPLIKESEKLENLKDLEDGYESIVRAFPPPKYVTVVVHGQMKAEDKDYAMNLFAQGKAQIMVATTVIEVGVNVPNATVMVIESAERFGLSQLHQLRGRVGRGADESYCVLVSQVKLTKESRKRLETMVSTNDGFQIAEVDLQLRGPGDITGTLQSGMPFDLKMANLATDGQLIQHVRGVVNDLLDSDPLLEQPQNSLLKNQLNKLEIHRTDYTGIS